MDKAGKSERKAKLKAWREGEHEKARALFPLESSRLQHFFDGVEALRAEHGCFHDIRHSMQVIDGMHLSDAEANALLDWCNDHGGFCDCEIAGNTFLYWRDARV